MKKLILIFLAPLVFSCGGNSRENAESGNVLENFSFTTDTVVVNPGGEILNLAWGLRGADFSPDKSELFLFNDTDQTIAVVDLNGLKLIRKEKFEKEGPHGIGQYINGIQALDGDSFLFKGYQSNHITSTQGVREASIKFLAENIDSLSKDNELNTWYGLLMSRDGKHLFSLPGDFSVGKRQFLTASYPGQKGKLLKIPAMDFTAEMRVVLRSREMMSVYVEEISLQELNRNILIRASAGADIYLYDYANDSLRLVTFAHRLVPNKKEGKVQNEVSSQQEWKTEMAKLTEQISFEQFFEDEENDRYYRFARINLPKPDPEAEQKAEVYLFAYDRDFNLIGETRIEELTKVPAYPFFKDGKLWSYVNVDDELGFAVMDFSF